MKVVFEKLSPLKWKNADRYFSEWPDDSEIFSLMEYYKNLYPEAEVLVNKEYEQSWVEDGYYEPDENGEPGMEHYIDCSYYENIPYLNIYIEFKTEEDEAVFIMKESL